jgi:AcrR family transcriptional regulator
MRRSADDAEQTRNEILRVARVAFAEHGYANTSTSTVAAAAGVTRGALYHHFDDKHSLFRSVFVKIVHQLNEAVLEAALAAPDPASGFRAACKACLDFMMRPDYRQIAMIDAPSVLGRIEWQTIDAGVGLNSMRTGLNQLEKIGLLRRPSTPALALLLFGALTEAGLTLARPNDFTPTQDEVLDTLLEIVIHDDAQAALVGRSER